MPKYKIYLEIGWVSLRDIWYKPYLIKYNVCEHFGSYKVSCAYGQKWPIYAFDKPQRLIM